MFVGLNEGETPAPPLYETLVCINTYKLDAVSICFLSSSSSSSSSSSFSSSSSPMQQISVSQLSCTCELTVRHSVISLDCTEVYDESLNSDTESPQPAPLVDISTVQSILPSPNFISSPQECLQELARINMMSAGSMYLHSPPHLMPASTCMFNPPGVEMMVEEFAELPSSHHPWAISPSHPPPLSHFAYQPM